MELNIVHEVAALQRLSVGQLRQRFAELFGEAAQPDAPEPTSLIPWAAFGLGLLVYATRKGRQTQPAVQSA